MSDCGEELDAGDAGPVEVDEVEVERLFNAELARAAATGLIEADTDG